MSTQDTAKKDVSADNRDSYAESLLRQRVKVPPEVIADFCRRHHIKKLAFFGSVLRDDFRPESDIDVLVEFEPGKTPGFAIYDVEQELSGMLGRKADLRTSGELSPYFRDHVVGEARGEYAPRQPNKDIARVRHMLDFARQAVEFNRGRTLADFESDPKLSLATVHLIELIGEAAYNVSENMKKRYPAVPWVKTYSTRNRLIHGYIDLNLGTIWSIVTTDLPPLIKQIEQLLESEGL